MDKRNENSRRAICDAYMRSLRENPHGKIKIDSLCAAAGVSKATFYNNYKNMADMLRDMEWRFVKTVVNSVPRQSYTFIRPQLFTTELTLAFYRYIDDIKLIFGSDGLVRMLYLMEKEVKAEIFGLYPQYKYDTRMNIILTYCIMGASNANILNPQAPFDELVKTINEITTAMGPLMNQNQQKAGSDNETAAEDNNETIRQPKRKKI